MRICAPRSAAWARPSSADDRSFNQPNVTPGAVGPTLPHSSESDTDPRKFLHIQGFPLSSTRRQFLLAASALVLAGALAGTGIDLLGGPAVAQTVAQAELMQPGPLGDVAMGDANAPVTIIEYASMTCPHCANFAVNTFPALKEKYIDTGKVRFIFREFPFDPIAAGAFMLARCAGNDKYFAVVDLKPLAPLLATVKQAGFTEESFKACLANQKVLDGIEWVRNRAADKFKVDSTPTFFINGKKQSGALSMEELDKAIQPLLKS
jgi:protein-disulfide isomerase